MASFHELSCLTPLNEFDIFSVPPTQNTIIQDIETEYRPTSALNSKSFIEFRPTSGEDEYIRLDKAKLHIKIRVKIEKPLKTDVTAEDWAKVSTVNNLFNSLFKQVNLMIGDRVVTFSHQTYPYKTDLEIKLGKSKEAKESYLSSILWIEDNKDEPEEINQERSAFIKPLPYAKEFKNGRIIDLIGKIHLPMFEQLKPLPGGTSVTVKFIPNNPAFYMMCTNDIRITDIDFIDASLHVHKSKVYNYIVEAHAKALQITNAKYPIREGFVVPITVNKGTMDIIIDNVHNGQLPKRAFVTMVNHTAYNGSETLNPFNYQHFNLCYLSFHCNGVQYPDKPYTPDFDNNLYVREYLSLFEATNQDGVDSCITLKREDFTKGNNIFAVNFSPDLQSGCCSTGYTNLIKYGALRLNLKWAKALEKTITVLVYLDYDTLLEINQERNPVYGFN